MKRLRREVEGLSIFPVTLPPRRASVRRFLRILLNAATVLSLLLCVATIVLWVRSGQRTEGIGWRSSAGTMLELFSERGRLHLERIGGEADVGLGSDDWYKTSVVGVTCWAYSVPALDREKLSWSDLADAHMSDYPYRRWGLRQVRLDPDFPVGLASWVFRDWVEHYDVHTPRVPNARFDRFGISMRRGERYVPYWTHGPLPMPGATGRPRAIRPRDSGRACQRVHGRVLPPTGPSREGGRLRASSGRFHAAHIAASG